MYTISKSNPCEVLDHERPTAITYLASDARLIVRACNAHEGLVKALERFISYGNVFGYRANDGSPYEQALEALASAKGEM